MVKTCPRPLFFMGGPRMGISRLLAVVAAVEARGARVLCRGPRVSPSRSSTVMQSTPTPPEFPLEWEDRTDAGPLSIVANFEARQYARNPVNPFDVPLLPEELRTPDLVLLIHGLEDPRGPVDGRTWSRWRTAEHIQAMDIRAGIDRDIVDYDWMEWARLGNELRASFDGQMVGTVLGRQLALRNDLRSIHVIAASVGAFVAEACARAYRAGRKGNLRARIRMTLLDPFTTRGALGLGYGMRHFGEAADFAEHFLNTDDFVPSTNDPLPLTRVYDVTRSAERSAVMRPGDNMHAWPVAYFTRHYTTRVKAEATDSLASGGGGMAGGGMAALAAEGPASPALVWPSHGERPRGTIVAVD